MRRILVNYAKPGMTLAGDLHDGYGHVLFEKGTQLTPEHTQTMARLGVSELLIEDERVSDVIVSPIIAPELAGAAAEALTQILVRLQSRQQPERTGVGTGPMRLGAPSSPGSQPASSISADLTMIRRVSFEMVQQLFPAPKGDPTISGCHSAEDYDFILPVKIAGLSLLMGKVAGFNQTQLVNLGTASLLQNIGYTRVSPQQLTQKPGALWEELAFVRAWRTGKNGPGHEQSITAAELQSVWKHSEHSTEILRQTNSIDGEVNEIILQHHERWNGSGYPGELRGKEIMAPARILAIADTCCTMASKRPYREAFLPHEVAELIVAYSGELYDPEMVHIFIENVPTFPTGVMVKLNTGEVGIVTDSNVGLIGRPKVRVCIDKDSRPTTRPFEVDLAEPQNREKLIATTVEY